MSSASSAASGAHRRVDARCPRAPPRQPQIQLEMARLSLVQAREHLCRRTVQDAAQGGEALARSGFDEGPADHEIDLALGLAARDQLPQTLRIAARRQPLGLDREPAQELPDLLVMTQLLAREARHLLGELEVLGIGEHQGERRRGRLLLAVRMIDDQHIELALSALDPALWGRREQQRVDGPRTHARTSTLTRAP